MEDYDIIPADFEKISSIYGVNHIGNEFLMIDNLQCDHVIEEADSVFIDNPIRSKTHTVFFCVKGSFRIKVVFL